MVPKGDTGFKQLIVIPTTIFGLGSIATIMFLNNFGFGTRASPVEYDRSAVESSSWYYYTTCWWRIRTKNELLEPGFARGRANHCLCVMDPNDGNHWDGGWFARCCGAIGCAPPLGHLALRHVGWSRFQSVALTIWLRFSTILFAVSIACVTANAM